VVTNPVPLGKFQTGTGGNDRAFIPNYRFEPIILFHKHRLLRATMRTSKLTIALFLSLWIPIANKVSDRTAYTAPFEMFYMG